MMQILEEDLLRVAKGARLGFPKVGGETVMVLKALSNTAQGRCAIKLHNARELGRSAPPSRGSLWGICTYKKH